MLTREDLQAISINRLKEAETLYEQGQYDGAKYLLGYTLETALKARICKILDSNYPDKGELTKVFFTHKFDILIVLAGLERQFNEKKDSDLTFESNWSLIIGGWKEDLRYEKIGTAKKEHLDDLFNALRDENHGILTWIQERW